MIALAFFVHFTPPCAPHGSYVYAAGPSNNYLQQHCRLIRRDTNLYWCPAPKVKR